MNRFLKTMQKQSGRTVFLVIRLVLERISIVRRFGQITRKLVRLEPELDQVLINVWTPDMFGPAHKTQLTPIVKTCYRIGQSKPTSTNGEDPVAQLLLQQEQSSKIIDNKTGGKIK